ncbi:MAG: TIR domain-containing protein, partial [Chloroflexota bacterium]
MTDTTDRPLNVFLCYARSDLDAVRGLYQRLTRDGIAAWFDKESLLPGQDWRLEIRRAVEKSDVVIVCLSKNFNTAGFQQKEVRLALDTADEKPEGEIFIIPVRLEECDGPDSLTRWQWVDFFEKDGYRHLRRALEVRAQQIGAIQPEKKGGGAPIKPPRQKKEKPEPKRDEVVRNDIPQTIEAGRDVVGRDQTIKASDGGTVVQGDVSGTIIHAQNVYIGDHDDLKPEAPTATPSQPEQKASPPPIQTPKLQTKPAEVQKPKSKKSTRKRNTQIIVAVIGAAGVIIAAVLGALPWKGWFAPAPLPTEITDSQGVTMRLVLAGAFTMGSNNGDSDEQPVHDVYLDSYYIDKYEVTNAFYKT